MSDARFTLAGRAKAFTFALAGMRSLWRGEPTTRFHAVGSVLALLGAQLLGFAAWEWAFVILSIGLVWFAEAINSAVERACDAITLEPHPMIGLAKDLAAASVLIVSITVLLLAFLLYGRHLLTLAGTA